MKYDIFISYRHEGGVDKAHILKQHLCSLGYDVFFDHEACSSVVNAFETTILAAIEVAPVFLLVLSQGCFDECGDKKNWVRREIEHAIKCRKPIIPVVIADEQVEFDKLPPETPDFIRELKDKHHFATVDFGSNFKSTVEGSLVKKIKEIVTPRIVTADTSKKGSIIHFFSDIPCRVFKYGRQIALTDPLNEGADSSVARLLKGRHKLVYISIEHAADSFSEILRIEDNDMEDFVEIKLQGIKEERLKREELLRQQEERKAAEEKSRLRHSTKFKYDFFFIYSSKDALMVRLVKDHMEAAGYSCWAESFDSDITKPLKSSHYAIYFHSENSLKSRFVKAELAQANEAGKKIKLVHLDDSPLDYGTLSLIGNTKGVKLLCRKDMQNLFESLLDPNFKYGKA